MPRQARAAPEMPTSIVRLSRLLKPRSGHVVQADDRHAVEVFEARAQRDELEEVRDDVDVDAFAARFLDEPEHLDVLFERERDVEVIDTLLADDLAALGERAEQRQPAVADVVAGGAIVEKADDLEAELAVFEQLVGDQPAEVACAGDQHALQPDAGAPSPLERLAHELS